MRAVSATERQKAKQATIIETKISVPWPPKWLCTHGVSSSRMVKILRNPKKVRKVFL